MKEQNLTPEQLEKRRKRESYKRELALAVYAENKVEPPSSLRYVGRVKNFLIVPDELTFSGKHLSSGELRLWLAIFAHNRKPSPAYRISFPGRDRLAMILGISPRQVSRFLEGLRRKDLLLTRKRMGRPSDYILDDPPRTWLAEMNQKLEALSRAKKIERQESHGEED